MEKNRHHVRVLGAKKFTLYTTTTTTMYYNLSTHSEQPLTIVLNIFVSGDKINQILEVWKSGSPGSPWIFHCCLWRGLSGKVESNYLLLVERSILS